MALANLFGGRPQEERAITYQTLWGAAADLVARNTWSGSIVTEDTSLRLGTLYAAVRLLTDAVATLPVDTFQRVDGQRVPYRPKPIWVDSPDIGVTRQDHFMQVMVSLLLDGSSFTRIYRNEGGEVVALVVLAPRDVVVERIPGTGEIQYRWKRDTILRADEVLQISELLPPGQLRGLSRVEMCKEVIGHAMALDEFSSRFFGQGSITSGIIESPAQLNKEQAQDLKQGFEGGHKGLRKSHLVGVLSGGAKFTKTGVDPEEAQLLASREFAVEEIARIFRIPPTMLGVTKPGASSHNSVDAQGIQFAQYTLRPYVEKIETAYSTLLPAGAFMKFNMDGIQRGDLATRFQAYSTGIQGGFLSINDIHRLEDMRPVDGGDAYRVPLANVNLQAANITELDRRISMAQRLVVAGFDPSDALKAVGLPDIKHTGVPSVQLQQVATLDPNDPASVYPKGEA
jgi:HK97 family phage portal protein